MWLQGQVQLLTAMALLQVCDAAEAECETILESGQSRVLPSTTRYAARFAACRKRFDAVCVGPGAARQVRLIRALHEQSTASGCTMYPGHIQAH